LVKINGEPMLKAKARKTATCVASGKPINKGDEVYRPLSNSSTRSSRFLASVVESQEAEQNEILNKRRENMMIFRCSAEGDEVFIKADNLAAAKSRFKEFMGDVPQSLLKWEVVESAPEGTEFLKPQTAMNDRQKFGLIVVIAQWWIVGLLAGACEFKYLFNN
jgi:hypothetical protein